MRVFIPIVAFGAVLGASFASADMIWPWVIVGALIGAWWWGEYRAYEDEMIRLRFPSVIPPKPSDEDELTRVYESLEMPKNTPKKKP